MMLPSMELRWFKEGEIPQVMKDWFLDIDSSYLNVEKERVDYYHHFTEQGSLGTKIRDALVQVKELHEPEDQIFINDRVSGRIEYWKKWSFEMNGNNDSGQIKNYPHIWKGIRKNRWQRFYAPEEEGVNMVAPGHTSEDICSFELTEIELENKTWWTLGFESTGNNENLLENLRTTVHEIFEQNQGPDYSLDITYSYSYPYWLAFIAGK